MKNLIENDGKNPIEKLMIYRNDKTTDVDRRNEVINSYRKLGMLTNRKTQEPDTFLASGYDTLRKLMRKYDRKFYEEDFRIYIEKMHIDYNNLSNNDAQFFRKNWYNLESTYEHYPVMVNKTVNRYVNASHVLGNFSILPKAYGGSEKCIYHHENPILYLIFVENNWNEFRECFNDIDFNEYIRLMFLEDLYNDGKICMNEFSIDYLKSFEEIYVVMENIVNFIEKREIKMYRKLKERGKN